MKKASSKKNTISNSPEEIDIVDIDYWINKAKIGFSFDAYHKKGMVRPYIFAYAPKSIATNQELILLSLEYHTVNFFAIHDDLKNDKQFVLKYISQCDSYISYSCFPQFLQHDTEIFNASFLKYAEAFRWLPNELKRDRNFVLDLAKKNGLLLEFLPLLYENDLEILHSAVTQNCSAIKFLTKKQSSSITTDIEFARKIVNTNHSFLPFINLKLRNNYDFIMPYIQQNYSNFEYAGATIRKNKEVVRFCYRSSFLMRLAGKELKSDEAFMLDAVVCNSGNIFHIEDNLKTHRFYSKAVNLKPDVYQYLPSEEKNHPGIIACALIERENFTYLPIKIQSQCTLDTKSDVRKKQNKLYYF